MFKFLKNLFTRNKSKPLSLPQYTVERPEVRVSSIDVAFDDGNDMDDIMKKALLDSTNESIREGAKL